MEKRKDSKGRNLKDGESQLSDGRYRYRFTDAAGKRHDLYSWRLVSTDRTPTGKRDSEPLREQEERISQDLQKGVDPIKANKNTLNQTYERWYSTLTGRKRTTMHGWAYMYSHFVKDSTIGNMAIGKIKKSDISSFYANLINEGKSLNTIRHIQHVLFPVFEFAMDDEIIAKNPTDGVVKKLKAPKPEKRHALTLEETNLLLEFMDQSNSYRPWKPVFTLLLGTGMRVGEATGLVWSDIDFEHETITVSRNLQFGMNKEHKRRPYIDSPKTEAGARSIPLLPDVKEALSDIRKLYFSLGRHCVQTIDGVTDFVLLNHNGKAFDYQDIDHAFQRICERANEWEKERAENEHRKPVEVRRFSAHNLRHTFCTRLCEQEADLSIIMAIMGHDNASTTLQIYNEVQHDHKAKAFDKLRKSMKIA